MSDEKVFNNWEDLLESLNEYVEKTPNANIVLGDNPSKLQIGFMCLTNDIYWRIGIADLKRCYGCMEGDDKEKLNQLVINSDNRRAFCDELCGRNNE